jgi:prepilin-type N-terminal cleavage/methylation domain-containing protein
MKKIVPVLIKSLNSEGFTLMEVMVAVAILAIGLIGLLSLQNQTVALSQASKNLTIAALIAKEAFTEKELEIRGFSGIDLPLGDVPPIPLSLIRVAVKWEESGTERVYSLTGVVAPQIYGEGSE